MNLPYDLISQFAKITKDKDPVKKETTVYGTVVSYAGSKYVKLDGSDLLTPVSTTVDTDVNDRVTVLVKNHTATVTGNLTSPAGKSASITVVSEEVAEFEKVIADLVTTESLDVVKGRIDTLESNNVTIKENLSANNASIDTLEANDITINNKLTAQRADIDDLKANTLTAGTIQATYATIASLDSTNANVDNLLADVANIDTLIFGSASGTTIQTSFSNSVIAQLGDAQIKSAMIESVSADKITAGDIITNNVRVKSEDGSLIISDETMQISDSNRVRVQIGKDAANDYSINIWDQNGNLMFSKGGITDSAIKEAIIRNDMVSDTANIAAHKLDIDSLFEEINDSTNTIKSTQIYLDDEEQTLDVAFKELSTTVTSQGTTISSQGTAISVIQGQIESKIWQQDIDTAADEMSTQYSTLEQSLSSFETTVGETYATKTELNELEIGGRNYVLNSDEEKHITSFYSLYSLSSAKSAMQGKTITVSFDAKRSEDSSAVNMYAYFRSSDGAMIPNSTKIGDVTTEYKRYTATIEPGADIDEAIHIAIHATITSPDVYVKNVKVEIGNKATDWTLAPEDVESDIDALDERLSTAETSITQNTKAIELRATKSEMSTAKSEAISSANTNTETLLGNYSTTSEMNAAIQLQANSITSSVSETYATKESVNAIDIGGKNLLKNSRHKLLSSNNSSTIPINKVLMNEDGREFYRYTRTSVDSSPTVLSLYSAIPVTDLTEKLTGNEVTFSWLMRCSHETTFDIMAWLRIDGTTTELPSDRTTESVGTEWKRVSFTEKIDVAYELDEANLIRANPRTFVIPDGEIENFYVDICEWKIEKGNRATDWTECPDDITRVEDVEVGGRNLVLSSDVERTVTNTVIHWNLSDHGIEAIKNKSITVSFDAYSSELDTGFDFYLRGVAEDGTVISGSRAIQNGVADSYTHYSATVEVDDDDYHTFTIRTGQYSLAGDRSSTATYHVKNVKVELGHKATDWTPAPEDVDAEITNLGARVTSAESSITQLSNKITANVTETTNLGTRMTTVEQTATELTVEVDNAAKTATDFLQFSDSGLIVGDMTADTLGKNVLIDSDSVDIRNGDKVLASFGADTVTLGRNAEESVIDLCGGAGRISANTAAASTSYPYRNAILLESKELELESVYCTVTASNEYESDTEPDVTRMAQLYMLRASSSSSVSNVRIVAEHLDNSTNTYVNSGFSALTYDTSSSTRALMYANDSGNKVYNQFNVYTDKATLSKSLYIDGIEFSGSNKVLWSGGSYMSASQTATLSEAISKQANGIVLVFSRYSASTAQNYHFSMHYIPKAQISNHGSCGHLFMLSTDGTFSLFAAKYLYIHDSKIVGNDINTETGTGGCGITYTNGGFVLRYVIGV